MCHVFAETESRIPPELDSAVQQARIVCLCGGICLPGLPIIRNDRLGEILILCLFSGLTEDVPLLQSFSPCARGGRMKAKSRREIFFLSFVLCAMTWLRHSQARGVLLPSSYSQDIEQVPVLSARTYRLNVFVVRRQISWLFQAGNYHSMVDSSLQCGIPHRKQNTFVFIVPLLSKWNRITTLLATIYLKLRNV